MNKDIEEFAKILIASVRDAAIRNCDLSLRPTTKTVIADRWRENMGRLSFEEFAADIIPDIVDKALFFLLHSIDEGSLKLTFTSKSGVVVDLNTAGGSEMAGWFLASGGWRAAYSKQRFVDYFKGNTES